MNLLTKTIIFGVVMTVIDIPWIILVMSKLYKKVFNIKLNKLAAGLAYLCMIIAYPLIISNYDTLKEQIRVAAFIGLITFGTYGFTLAAIYDKYPIENAVAETIWGITLYTLTTSISHYIIRKLS